MFKTLVFSLLFLMPLAFADDQGDPPEEFSSPRSTFRFYLKNMVKYKKGESDGLTQAARALYQDHFNSNTRTDSAQIAALKLIDTLDKLEKVDYAKIPDSRTGDEFVYKNEVVKVAGQEYAVEIALRKYGKKGWLFTKETVETIAYYERSLRGKKRVQGVTALNTLRSKLMAFLPNWFDHQIFLISNGQWIGLLLLVLFCYLLEKITRLYVGTKIVSILSGNRVPLTEDEKKSLTLPFGVIVFGGMLSIGLRWLELPDGVFSFFARVAIIIFTVGTVWATLKIVDITAMYFEGLAERSENKFDDILVPLLRKSAKVVVVAIGGLFIANSLTLNVTNLLAGLGIGGLAFALAAKDTLSNLFGSLTVLLDRPFQIGDWVLIGGNIEGTVVEVGFRSTRIRTFYDSIISVPNSQLTNIHIDNYGRRRYRRFSTKVNVQYDTPPEKLEAFCEGIRQIILEHKWTRKDYFHVYVNSLGAHSVDILLYVFWEVPDWSKELLEKHRLLVDILRLGQEMGVDFAFPTQTLHLIQDEMRKHNLEGFEDKLHKGSSMGAGIAQKPYSPREHRSDLDKCQENPPSNDSLGL